MRIRLGVLAVVAAITVACQGQPALRGFDIHAVPPSLTSGTGKAGLNGGGDLILEVSARGPADEISRPTRDPLQPNLIWHLLEGECAAWQQPGAASGLRVLWRWTPVPSQADAMDFQTVIGKGELGDLSRPHALAGFRNGGGGPLYTCGDLPPLRP